MRQTGDHTEVQVQDKTALNAEMKCRVLTAGGEHVGVLEPPCPMKEVPCRKLAVCETPLKFDYEHLTLTGVRDVVGRLRGVFDILAFASAAESVR